MPVRIQSNKNSHPLLMRMQHGTVTLKNCLTVLYKGEHMTFDPVISLLGIYPMDFENLCAQKNLHVNIYRFIYNLQKLKGTKMYFIR